MTERNTARCTSPARLRVSEPIAPRVVIGQHASAVVPTTFWAAALQQPQLPPADSVVVESPLPGGVAAITRFLLTTVPQWVQWAGLVVAAIVAVLVVWHIVRHRQAIKLWLATRSRTSLYALGGTAVAFVAVVAGLGAASYNYVQHSNEFCTSCHVMGQAFQKFGSAENKHNELSCHACHQQSMFDSMHELYVWLQERPDKIGEHAEVPNRICESCHVTGDTATWQRVASTAGHRVHLESDSSALKDLQCVTCHGEEVHRFKPVSVTCGQSGCHEQKDTDIALGKMSTQTSLHCTSCHAFAAEVPALATTDSARGTLTPGQPQCLGCHSMQTVLPDFNPERDPHGGKCGTCHNPHEQKTPEAAAQSCATCHAQWRDEPFHTGAAHRKVAEKCLTCHLPHQAKVDASDCTGCHANARSRGVAKPPMPFDTTRALRRTSALPHTPSRLAGHAIIPTTDVTPRRHAPVLRRAGAQGSGAVVIPSRARPLSQRMQDPRGPQREPLTTYGFTGHWPGDPAGDAWPPPVAADTFSHARHAKLACLVCHQTGTGLGRLTFERPRGCNICHHQASAKARCAACHQPEEVAAPIETTVAVTVPGRQPATRPVNFLHSSHTSQTCATCHTMPVTLAPSPQVAQCKDCHTDHHAADRTCSACHTLADAKSGHPTPEAAHQRCDACHTATTVARLTPTRTFCATCHAPQATNHYDQKQCSTCHFLAEPGVYRSKLTATTR